MYLYIYITVRARSQRKRAEHRVERGDGQTVVLLRGIPVLREGADHTHTHTHTYEPHVLQFCINGLVFPDRTPHPALEEVKHVHRPVDVKLLAFEYGEVNLDGSLQVQIYIYVWYIHVCICVHIYTYMYIYINREGQTRAPPRRREIALVRLWRSEF